MCIAFSGLKKEESFLGSLFSEYLYISLAILRKYKNLLILKYSIVNNKQRQDPAISHPNIYQLYFGVFLIFSDTFHMHFPK